jgi:hypothetical protein
MTQKITYSKTHCALEIVILCLHELLTLVFVHTVPSLHSLAQGKTILLSTYAFN